MALNFAHLAAMASKLSSTANDNEVKVEKIDPAHNRFAGEDASWTYME